MALPSEVEWQTLASLSDLAWWAGAKEVDIPALEALFGFEFDTFQATACRVLATITEEDLAAEIATWRIEGAPATLRHKAVARTMRRAAASLTTVSLPAPATETPTLDVITAALAKIAEGNQPRASDARKVIMANVIDPADSGEVPVAAASQVKEWHKNYRDLKSGVPLPDKDPTPDQIAALHTRIVVLGQ